MNPVELQELLRDFLQAIQIVMESGEVLSDEFQGELAQTLNLLLEAIESSQIPPAPPEGPELTQAMPSSNIDAFGYDQRTGRLMVRFLGRHPNRNGPVYSYEGVPPVIFDLFSRGAAAARTDGHNEWGSWWRGKSPSMGASLYTLLNLGGFPYQRLS